MSVAQVVCHFEFLCTQTWDDLQPISGTTTQRLCTQCAKPVYWVTTYHDLREHIKKSHCVMLKANDGTFKTGAIWRASSAG